MGESRVAAQFGIGQAVTRFEDPRLLRGQGRFINDVNLPGQAHAVVLRSPHAHAKIRSIDTEAARRAPGVLAVWTGADYARDGLGMPKATLPRKRPDGSPLFAPQRPAVTSTAAAGEPGSPPVWDECPDNISHVLQAGDRAAAEAAFARAAHVVRRRYVITRVFAHYMEPRGALGVYDPGEDRLTLHADVQYPHRVRNMLAEHVFKLPEGKVRVIAGDVGGAFGTKGWQYVEHRLVLWAARKLRRPVKWTCERSEAILADEHGRDNISDAELALDRGGRFLGLRVRMTANLGAYVGSDRNLLSPFLNVPAMVGVYLVPAAYVHVTAVLTNCSPTAPYRGAGRPEAIYVIERLIDDAARQLGLDALELRRKNLVPASAMPYRNALGFTYDCGDFAKGMELALKIADFAGFSGRREASLKGGKQRGLGFANAIERAAAPGLEFAEIRFDPSGTAMLLMGTKAQGQGHETTFKQILHERLGLDPAQVQFIDGDTDRVAFGMGTMGSRSTVIGGSALHVAAGKVI